MDLKNNFSILVLLLFASSFSFGQKPIVSKTDSSGIYKLTDVVVTATKTATPVYELANSISVISSADIANKNKGSVLNLLNDEYGLSITQQGAPGSLAQINIHGSNSGHTLILMDGIEVNLPNDPSNTFDFSNLSTDNIERIEILRGPQSTLYGSDALAGVINIITKQGNGKPEFSLNAEGGSYNTYKASLGANGKVSAFDYSVFAGKMQTDGFSSADKKFGNTEKDGSRNYYAVSRIGIRPLSNLKINLFARFNNASTNYDQFGGRYGDDSTYVYNLEEGMYRAEANYSLFGGVWTQTAGVSFFRNIRKYSYDYTVNNPASSFSSYDGRKIKFDWQNNFYISKDYILTAGLETEKEEANSDYYINSATGNFVSIFPDNKAVTTGTYLQGQFKFGSGFFASAGVRYDHHNKFGSVFTYRVAPAYIFWKTGTKLKATFGTGFKAPSLYYLYDPAFGNENLKPEKSTGWDAGIEQYLWNYRFTAGITYFQNDFNDLFGFDNSFKTVNIDKSHVSGIEAYFKLLPFKNLSVNSNYTFTSSINKGSEPEDSGKPLLRRPVHKFVFSADYKFFNKANGYFEVIYVGKRDDKDFASYPAERIELKPYTLVNISASYAVFKNIKIYGRINNLFNAQYEEVFGYGTPGLSGYLGINLSL